MNEPSNFVDGSEKGCTNDSYDEPPYIPSNFTFFLLQLHENYFNHFI